MNHSIRLLLALPVIACLISSCKKDAPVTPATTTTVTPESPGVYFKSDPGDYWVYTYVDIDTNNVETAHGTDSVYVAPDTVINGNTYHTYRGTWYTIPRTWHWRDSSYCIVNESGHVLFTTQLFNQTIDSIGDSAVYYGLYKVPSVQAAITVPAGTYTTYDRLGEMHMLLTNYPWGTIRYTHSNYASHVGLVREQEFYSSSPGVIERQLVRYHVN